MINSIPYVTDTFLDEFKTNFDEKYLALYEEDNVSRIKELFDKPDHIIQSEKIFDFEPLVMESEDTNAVKENVKILRKSLNGLSVVEAENEKLWVALENTYYLDYHLDQFKLITGKKKRQSIKSRTIFINGNKRSLVINNLALLWWLGHYTYDEESKDNPYHLTDFFLSGPYRGNAVAYLSSNIISNHNLALGSLEALLTLVKEKKIKLDRYSFTETNKLLNQIGGVRVIDGLSRDEIKSLVLANLPEMKVNLGENTSPVSN